MIPRSLKVQAQRVRRVMAFLPDLSKLNFGSGQQRKTLVHPIIREFQGVFAGVNLELWEFPIYFLSIRPNLNALKYIMQRRTFPYKYYIFLLYRLHLLRTVYIFVQFVVRLVILPNKFPTLFESGSGVEMGGLGSRELLHAVLCISETNFGSDYKYCPFISGNSVTQQQGQFYTHFFSLAVELTNPR